MRKRKGAIFVAPFFLQLILLVMKKYAVIVAGGNGIRMGTNIPKQFLLLQGKPVLWHTLNAFLHAYADVQIILVLPAAHFNEGMELIQDLKAEKNITLTEGGTTRFHSVQNGLKHVTEPSVVFVHDGVRCLITADLIHQCYEQALYKGSAIPVVAATDSIRMVEDESHFVLNRNQIRIIQTPQTFLSKLIIPAFEQSFEENFTDEATVVEASGEMVYLIDGDYQNIKITRPVDLLIAETILSERLNA
jgi:2-C-methyl-D-erythritol 4-phosphate cytidylyltransferase